MENKDKNLLSELKRMKILGGLLKENHNDFDNDVDYGDIAFHKRREVVEKLNDIFGKLTHPGSADWGGIPIWSIKGDPYEGYFVIDDSEFNEDNSFSILKREFNPDTEKNIDEILFTAFLTPERFNQIGDGTIEELIEKALEIKNSSEAIEEQEEFELPQNKKTINTKLSTKRAIQNALYKILKVEKVEGRYRDDSWAGVSKFINTLEGVGAEVDLVKSGYEGHGEVQGHESMPTKKVYVFNVSVRDKKGVVVTIQFMVNCIFVGQTGTMSDDVYEVTYYAMM